jgi:hypothetical protein
MGCDGNVVQDSTDSERLLSKALRVSIMGTRTFAPMIFARGTEFRAPEMPELATTLLQKASKLRMMI